jgi:predicted transcriptional regulator
MTEPKGPRVSVFRPRKDGLEKTLGALEAQIMDAVWDASGPVCVDDVRRALAAHGKDAAYTTVMTTLGRLFDKGFLTRTLAGKAYQYSAQVTRRELSSSVTQQVIDGLLATFAEPAMSYFVEALSVSDPDKLDALATLIDRKRAEGAAPE